MTTHFSLRFAPCNKIILKIAAVYPVCSEKVVFIVANPNEVKYLCEGSLVFQHRRTNTEASLKNIMLNMMNVMCGINK